MKTILVHSGGMDSTVLLYHLLDAGVEVRALSIDYGQRHKKELDLAKSVCEKLGVEHRIADLTALAPLLAGSSLTSDDIEVPDGHYAEGNMKVTVVPNRNMILLAVATGWAISTKSDTVSYAAHSGDHAIYPDCREEFAAGMDHVMQLADWQVVKLDRPFVAMTKADVAKRGAELGVPFDETWSCYKGLDLHCGRCGTCVERREAFHLAGVIDPTPYADTAPTVDEMIANDWRI
ncbi:7-cyano-7-deazaguanine synthase QueC [Coraliomargarita sp. SDUM461003]|uniref:7-cyano-7-deazaguanine synthase n=1 Tax=Thalassobacterium maritimum TaxID=3041265 RepID=A0ABU1ARK3_9BACT|nr:7-cyano-7-deazaguanine synthase QueC [Coraliomargarita sp. SDUM461003]MDQ8206673.1 7-cyano-7-deazaguanine synthase QueC [Coraliomargarita sp. SDUM461003]